MRTRAQKPKLPKANKQNQQPSTELTFLEHVYEVRTRAFWVVLSVIVASAAGFQFKDQLIGAVMAPLHGEKLVYLTPGGGFSFIFTLSIYFGLLVTIPIIIYNLYRFLQPLLKRSSKRILASFMIMSTMLAMAGAAFGYFVTIPAALNFLSTFAGDAVTPNLTAESYLNFVVSYVLGLALLFQLPLILFLLDHIRPFPPGTLIATQRFVIIGATVVAAVITPTPDAVNMALVAVPIVTIYEVGVMAVFARSRVRRARNKQTPLILNEQISPLSATIEEIIHEEGVSKQHTAPVVTAEAITQPVKSVDGFNRSVKHTQPLAIRTKRDELLKRQQLQAAVRQQSVRSIDGFSRTRQNVLDGNTPAIV